MVPGEVAWQGGTCHGGAGSPEGLGLNSGLTCYLYELGPGASPAGPWTSVSVKWDRGDLAACRYSSPSSLFPMLCSPEQQVAAGVMSSVFAGLPAEDTQRGMVGNAVSVAPAELTSCGFMNP